MLALRPYNGRAVIDQDWRVAATSVEHSLRFRIAFAGEAGYTAAESRVSDAIARCAFIVRLPGESLFANFFGAPRIATVRSV